MKKKIQGITAVVLACLMLPGCNGKDTRPTLTNPDKPTTITVWHYYNGTQQAAFDALTEKFNETVGKEKGIYVTDSSKGSIQELEDSVRASMDKEVGSEEPPNIFSSYSDTAYEIDQKGLLANLDDYLTEQDLEAYNPSYVEEGRIGSGGELRIFPTAKSTEITMVNKQIWEEFSAASGSRLDDLKTMEGLAKTGKLYYEWTDSLTPDVPNDGKAFYGRDAVANLFIIGSMQLGTEIFSVDNGEVTLNLDRTALRKIWDTYYVPYVSGYFGAYGRFRSDDVKTGELAAFTGSTTSSMYFPDEIESGGTIQKIDCIVLPPPAFEGGENYVVQQGAGMAVTKTTKKEEYASVEFLKWFTQAENNIQFGCESGYLPVKEEACSQKMLDSVIEDKKLTISSKTYDTLLVGFDMVKNSKMYTNKAFAGGTAARKVLENHLSAQASETLQKISEAMAQGSSHDEAVKSCVTDQAFENWYSRFTTELKNSVER